MQAQPRARQAPGVHRSAVAAPSHGDVGLYGFGEVGGQIEFGNGIACSAESAGISQTAGGKTRGHAAVKPEHPGVGEYRLAGAGKREDASPNFQI
jgi:hypothetical protein